MRQTKKEGARALTPAVPGSNRRTGSPVHGRCADDNSSGGSNLSGSIKVDGSSTVGPLTEAAAELFREQNPDVKITVGISGTAAASRSSAPARRTFHDASRPIEPEEVTACKKEGVPYGDAQVANDGIAVVGTPRTTGSRLPRSSRRSGSRSRTSSNWKNQEQLPGRDDGAVRSRYDSGTFEYFNEAINGDKAATRKDYSPSEDDNVTGRVLPVKANTGTSACPTRSRTRTRSRRSRWTAATGVSRPTPPPSSGSYKPLSRPLFTTPRRRPCRTRRPRSSSSTTWTTTRTSPRRSCR